MPLFAAIAHGCSAEREDEAFREVYRPRIARGNEDFATTKLGLYGQDLAALASFFKTPFTAPLPRLEADLRTLMLNHAGADLRALGRLEDAVIPLRARVKADMAAKDDRNAAMASGNLTQTTLSPHHGELSGEAGGQLPAGESSRCLAPHVTTPSAYSGAPRTRMRCGSWACSLMPKCYSAKQRPSRSNVSLPCLVSIRYRDSQIAICYSSAATVPKFLRV